MAGWDVPIRELISLQERMNRIFDESLFRGQVNDSVKSADWTPVVDIYELDTEYVINVELPGIEREAVAVDIENEKLRIRGERGPDPDVPRERYQRVERSRGTFARSFDIPRDVNVEAVKAEYKNGLLVLRLPKRSEGTSRLVSIEIE
jgi:HSP20 family protein